MVAELADISTATINGKAFPDAGGTSSKQRRRPKWIQTATREPIYSVLDSSGEIVTESLSSPTVLGKIVVISAVKNEPSRKYEPETPANSQRELPYVWLPSRNREPTILEVEDEDTLYSVVRKPKKVRLPETSSSDEEAIRPVDKARIEVIGPGEKPQPDHGDISRRVEVGKWLRDAPRQPLSHPPKMSSDRSEYENSWPDRENAVALPRGVVGLVGPYRIYRNPSETREYVLQEEELVEETVDSASEKAREESKDVLHRPRAKWKIREDDEETLVPDIRDLPGLDGFVETKVNDGDERSDGWKDERESAINMEKSGYIEGILPGKEERPVDVPDTVSAISTTSMKNKQGEEVYFTIGHARYLDSLND